MRHAHIHADSLHEANETFGQNDVMNSCGTPSCVVMVATAGCGLIWIHGVASATRRVFNTRSRLLLTHGPLGSNWVLLQAQNRCFCSCVCFFTTWAVCVTTLCPLLLKSPFSVPDPLYYYHFMATRRFSLSVTLFLDFIVQMSNFTAFHIYLLWECWFSMFLMFPLLLRASCCFSHSFVRFMRVGPKRSEWRHEVWVKLKDGSHNVRLHVRWGLED